MLGEQQVYAVHLGPGRHAMTPDRRLALWAGILYLATFATSFPALALKSPILAG